MLFLHLPNYPLHLSGTDFCSLQKAVQLIECWEKEVTTTTTATKKEKIGEERAGGGRKKEKQPESGHQDLRLEMDFGTKMVPKMVSKTSNTSLQLIQKQIAATDGLPVIQSIMGKLKC